MNAAELYVLNCLKTGVRISNRRVNSLGGCKDYSRIFDKYYNLLEKPKCEWCKTKSTQFISLRSGYRKYCSKECYKEKLSQYNRENNYIKNKKLSKKAYLEKIPKLELAKNEYLSSDSIIKELSENHQLSYSRLRKFLNQHNAVRKNHSTIVRNKQFQKRFKPINEFLDNVDWVNSKIELGWTSQNFADYFDCSKNYVCSYLRNLGRPLQFNAFSSKITNLLDSYNVYYEKNNRTLISPFEIDIFIPDKKLAIEVNGYYWHSTKFKDKNYHQLKTNLCLKKNINLIHLLDVEIDHKWAVVESEVKRRLGLCRKILVENTKILDLDQDQYKFFCKRNSIKGYAYADDIYGLSYENEIVFVVGFKKLENNDYELVRYVYLNDVMIENALDKIIKHFISIRSSNNIIMAVDRRIESKKENFNHVKTIRPKQHIINNYMIYDSGQEIVKMN